MWGNGSTVLPHSHATQVADGLEKARGMAETPRLPRAALGGRLKDVSQGTTERLQPSCPRILRGDVARWLYARLGTHPVGMPTLPPAAAVAGFGVGSAGLSGQIF